MFLPASDFNAFAGFFNEDASTHCTNSGLAASLFALQDAKLLDDDLCQSLRGFASSNCKWTMKHEQMHYKKVMSNVVKLLQRIGYIFVTPLKSLNVANEVTEILVDQSIPNPFPVSQTFLSKAWRAACWLPSNIWYVLKRLPDCTAVGARIAKSYVLYNIQWPDSLPVQILIYQEGDQLMQEGGREGDNKVLIEKFAAKVKRSSNPQYEKDNTWDPLRGWTIEVQGKPTVLVNGQQRSGKHVHHDRVINELQSVINHTRHGKDFQKHANNRKLVSQLFTSSVPVVHVTVPNSESGEIKIKVEEDSSIKPFSQQIAARLIPQETSV